MKKTNAVTKLGIKVSKLAEDKPKAIIASIFLDLILSLKIDTFIKKFNAAHSEIDPPIDLATIIQVVFFSASIEDVENRKRFAEILDIQAKRFAIYSFRGCDTEDFSIYGSFSCEPEITCPAGGTPPCCMVEESNFTKMYFDAAVTQSLFKNIVYWGNGVTVEGFDKNDKPLVGVIETIGIIDDLLIKKIDFSAFINELKYIKINEPYALIQVPSN